MVGSVVTLLENLLNSAVRAPSGDNTQPWKFVVDSSGDRISFRLDETRDPSPMNAGQRMARIAVGAAVENLVRVAACDGWGARLEPAVPPDLAVVRLTRNGPGTGTDPSITARMTNRRLYDRRPVPENVVAGLANDVGELQDVKTYWIVDRDRLSKLADLIGSADALMFGEPSMRQAFLSKVRFDAPPDHAVSDGLSLGSLELSSSDRIALRLMKQTPNWVLQMAGAGRIFAGKARDLVESASGLCLVVAPNDKDGTDLDVGRTMQRAWLALSARDFSVQPMMSLMVLENSLEKHNPVANSASYRARVTLLSQRFRELIPEIGKSRPAFLLRFGHAQAPSGRTGRLAPAAEWT